MESRKDRRSREERHFKKKLKRLNSKRHGVRRNEDDTDNWKRDAYERGEDGEHDNQA